MREKETRRAALLNEHCEPCDVGVASEVSGLDAALPEAGNQDECGYQ
jgi:hypothetical protein